MKGCKCAAQMPFGLITARQVKKKKNCQKIALGICVYSEVEAYGNS